jgi:hypothetical protein
MAGLLYGAQGESTFGHRIKSRNLADVNFSYTCLDTRVGELESSLLSARKEAEEAREQILSLEAASLASISGLTQQMADLRYRTAIKSLCVFPSYLRIRFCGPDPDPAVGSGP